MSLSISCIQMASQPFHRDANLFRARAAIENAAADGADLLLLPEFFADGYTYDRRVAEAAETIDGDVVEWMHDRSTQTGCWIAGSIVEKSHRRRDFDTLVLVSPDGRTWSYRKRALPFFENLYFRRGDRVGIFETELGRIGVMLCWDMIHERLVRELEDRIDLLLVCSAWPDVRTGTIRLRGLEGWLGRPPLNRPRELASRLNVPVAYCNLAGRFSTRVPMLRFHYEADFAGCSTIIDQRGHGIIAPTCDEATINWNVDIEANSELRRAA